MMAASRRLGLHVGFALLSMAVIFCNGCSRLASLNFTRTKMDQSSRTYPTVQSLCRCTTRFTAYAFYSPDMDNDGHDTSLKFASRWLKGFLDPLLEDEAFTKKTLIVVTFDESGDSSAGSENHIYTVFLGGMVQSNKEVGSNYNHYNVLRTIEENFGLCPLGEGDGGAKPIADVWK